MAMKTAFVVQPFELHRKRLRPGRQEPASTESGALKKPENLAKRMPGAVALKVVADDETGELEGVTILGQWGEIPDDFAESLQGGSNRARARCSELRRVRRRPRRPELQVRLVPRSGRAAPGFCAGRCGGGRGVVGPLHRSPPAEEQPIG